MIQHLDISKSSLKRKIKQKEISLGGNQQLKIYGTLHCKTGKRMKEVNRVFFTSEREATAKGFRPCSQCMNKEYKKWKDGFIQ